jgi:hypothetical protein
MRRGANRFRVTRWGREKFCAYCRAWWAVESFRAHPGGAGGLDNRCRACQAERRTTAELTQSRGAEVSP